jgi:ABC-type glycerol-3-phosphate transport system permease component
MSALTGRPSDARTLNIRLGRIALYVVTVGLSLLFLFPFIWTLSSSLKTSSEVIAYPPAILPKVIQWKNYYETWTSIEFGTFFTNSVIVAGLTLLGGVSSAFLVAYGFARFRFPGRDAAFALCLSTMILPPEVTIIPLFIAFKNIHWTDSLKPLIVPSFFGGGAFSIFLLRQFILTLPYDLDEAAMIDGAGRLRILTTLILPNSRPALATVAIFSFISHWNDFFGPLIFLNSREHFTIPLGLYSLKTYAGDPGEPKDHLLMAGSVIATLPIILIFLVAQRYFIRGIVTSGIKG